MLYSPERSVERHHDGVEHRERGGSQERCRRDKRERGEETDGDGEERTGVVFHKKREVVEDSSTARGKGEKERYKK